mgnify:CR=1 FL=1
MISFDSIGNNRGGVGGEISYSTPEMEENHGNDK